jgi:hypothetical protein
MEPIVKRVKKKTRKAVGEGQPAAPATKKRRLQVKIRLRELSVEDYDDTGG